MSETTDGMALAEQIELRWSQSTRFEQGYGRAVYIDALELKSITDALRRAAPVADAREAIARTIRNELLTLDIGCGDTVNIHDALAAFRNENTIDMAMELVNNFSAWCADAILALNGRSESATEDWSCIADLLDDIHVDDKGMCRWADVANAQTNIRHTARTMQRSTPTPPEHTRAERGGAA